MRIKKFTFLSLILLSVTVITGFQIFEIRQVHYSTGPEPGHNGGPAGGTKTCANCHIGSSVRQMNSVITSNIPESGYIPNHTYTIYLNISEENLKRYGFQVSAENASGNHLGYFIVTDDFKTQLNTSDDRYINHTYDGIDFPDGKAQWSFDWVAPAEGSGTVTFYGAFILSDESYNPLGDIVATSSITVDENVITFSKTDPSNKLLLNLHPNPASESIKFSLRLDKQTDLQVNILQPDGKMVWGTAYRNLGATDHHFNIPVSNLQTGLYHLILITTDGKKEEKFWVEQKK